MNKQLEMKIYLGVKTVGATEMNLGDYNNYRGWTIPENENPLTEGYLVVYEDGYKSWCPKKQFEESNRLITSMTFGHALEAMKRGDKVARTSWNGNGMWAVIQKGYPNGIAINKNTAEATGFEEGSVMKFRPYFLLYTAQKDFAHWVPSGSDIIGEDWYIVGIGK